MNTPSDLAPVLSDADRAIIRQAWVAAAAAGGSLDEQIEAATNALVLCNPLIRRRAVTDPFIARNDALALLEQALYEVRHLKLPNWTPWTSRMPQ
jgi:hypothetical protein